ncbi:hypothetical protein CSUI_006825 [Cystoisospora suis]|uniref:Transmembrane protein n=1 Tax=Cystoisospora suis TaxID=483139 RepID=A0A2C6KS58_9APIC|nr:hypothetical protein CSUI_006825 [Cystoisospora suis]
MNRRKLQSSTRVSSLTEHTASICQLPQHPICFSFLGVVVGSLVQFVCIPSLFLLPPSLLSIFIHSMKDLGARVLSWLGV